MKALTIWPPYAAAIAAGIKRIETRLRPIRFRGPRCRGKQSLWEVDL